MQPTARRQTAVAVARRLREAGFRALLAGGCVRDALLGRPSSDYDVATDATPRQVRRLFPRVLLVGARFGVAVVLRGRERVEVATFRSDASYSDGRRPDAVRFSSPREDALRRDFTINGMFYDPVADEVIDYVGGREDLARRVVRTIGEPDQRFAEDYLRMVRAVRFAVALDFRIDPGTAEAIRRHAPKIARISGERIFDELRKMLSKASAPAALERLGELRLAAGILPELLAAEGAWPAGLQRVRQVAGREDLPLTLAALLADVPRQALRAMVRRWGASNELRDALTYLAAHMNEWDRAEELPLCEFKRRMAGGQWDRLRRLWRAEERRRTGREVHSRRVARRAGQIDPADVAPPPLVTGSDLLRMGVPAGPGLGKLLRQLYDAQLNEELTTRPGALARARELAGGAAGER